MADLHFRNLFTSFTLWKSFPHISTLKAVNRARSSPLEQFRAELRSHAKEGSDPGTEPSSEPLREHIFNRS